MIRTTYAIIQQKICQATRIYLLVQLDEKVEAAGGIIRQKLSSI